MLASGIAPERSDPVEELAAVTLRAAFLTGHEILDLEVAAPVEPFAEPQASHRHHHPADAHSRELEVALSLQAQHSAQVSIGIEMRTQLMHDRPSRGDCLACLGECDVD